MRTPLWLAAALVLLGACGGSDKKTKQSPQAVTCLASPDCSVSKQTLERRAMMRMEQEVARRGERRDSQRAANDRRDEQK